MRKFAIGVVALIAASAQPALASSISTVGSWDGSNFVLQMGEFDTATYGQTFTAPADNVLTSFTFYVNDNENPDFLDFAAYVYAWDGLKATGPALFTSGGMSTTDNGGAGGFETITVNTGGVTLATGSQYVAFLSASNFFDGIQGTSIWGYLNADVYAGGGFWFSNNGNNFAALTTNNWENFVGGGVNDLAFSMEFSPSQVPVPEPTSLLLFGTGAAGLIVKARRRKKQ
jgi:hypothetical protein